MAVLPGQIIEIDRGGEVVERIRRMDDLLVVRRRAGESECGSLARIDDCFLVTGRVRVSVPGACGRTLRGSSGSRRRNVPKVAERSRRWKYGSVAFGGGA